MSDQGRSSSDDDISIVATVEGSGSVASHGPREAAQAARAAIVAAGSQTFSPGSAGDDDADTWVPRAARARVPSGTPRLSLRTAARGRSLAARAAVGAGASTPGAVGGESVEDMARRIAATYDATHATPVSIPVTVQITEGSRTSVMVTSARLVPTLTVSSHIPGASTSVFTTSASVPVVSSRVGTGAQASVSRASVSVPRPSASVSRASAAVPAGVPRAPIAAPSASARAPRAPKEASRVSKAKAGPRDGVTAGRARASGRKPLSTPTVASAAKQKAPPQAGTGRGSGRAPRGGRARGGQPRGGASRGGRARGGQGDRDARSRSTQRLRELMDEDFSEGLRPGLMEEMLIYRARQVTGPPELRWHDEAPAELGAAPPGALERDRMDQEVRHQLDEFVDMQAAAADTSLGPFTTPDDIAQLSPQDLVLLGRHLHHRPPPLLEEAMHEAQHLSPDDSLLDIQLGPDSRPTPHGDFLIRLSNTFGRRSFLHSGLNLAMREYLLFFILGWSTFIVILFLLLCFCFDFISHFVLCV